MKTWRAFFSLPLLAKELTEIAARRRTYTTRVVYAVLLYAGFALINRSLFQITNEMGVQEFRNLGVGRQMFEALMVLQIFGIYLFLPAMAAGQLTQEKERDSLVLLFLTELTPWQMLLQKYAGALIAIFSFLLIGMPLAALCYACGGLSPETLFTGVYVLFLTSLQVAAFALMCSAFARTTVAAFIATYIGQVALFFGVGFSGQFIGRLADAGRNGYANEWLHIFAPTILINGNDDVQTVLLRSFFPLASTSVFLLLARFFFVRRAFAPARNRLLMLFRRVDAFMQRANRRIGGVTFLRRDRALPGDDPIAWRELTRTALGRSHYLARVLLALEIPTLALGMLATIDGPHSEALSILAAVLGALAVLALSAFSANAFVSERVNQTLEVLLTTPLRAADIVQQKARMLTRFAWVLAVPVGTVFAVSWWIRWDGYLPRWNTDSPWLYLLCAVLTLAVYLPLVLWLSLWIGLKMRTRFRAILTALGMVVGWCAVPILLCFAFDLEPSRSTGGWLLALASPVMVPFMNEQSGLGEMFRHASLVGVAINFLSYRLITDFIRRRCLSRADAYLRST